MKIHYIVTAILIIGLVTTGLVVFIEDVSTSYGKTADMTGLTPITNSISNTTTDATDLADDISKFPLEEGEGALSIPYKLIKTAGSALRTIFGSFGVVTNIFGYLITFATDNRLPVPPFVKGIVIAIFLFTIVAIMIYAFFKWKIED